MHIATLISLVALQWAGAGPRAPPRARRSAMSASLGLTPELEQVVETFKMVPDQKLRYQQLLFLAQKAKPMDAALKVPDNKVPGCLSTVYVSARADDSKRIFYEGDSDAMLTKGLVVLLTEGLSGHTAEEILRVDPKFIQEAGIAASLTPGRNNGLLNMLQLMKQKAQAIGRGASAGTPAAAAAPAAAAPRVEGGGGPVADSIIAKVCDKLKPSSVKLVDNSAQHAGHAGREGLAASETHFALDIVSDVFAGLSQVQRHKLVYALLADELAGSVHALQITARTTSE
jgi:sulfur transfer protein SufE/stress-induced morphogen